MSVCIYLCQHKCLEKGLESIHTKVITDTGGVWGMDQGGDEGTCEDLVVVIREQLKVKK